MVGVGTFVGVEGILVGLVKQLVMVQPMELHYLMQAELVPRREPVIFVESEGQRYLGQQ